MAHFLPENLVDDLRHVLRLERESLARWNATIRSVRRLLLDRRIADATEQMTAEMALLGEQRQRRDALRRRLATVLRLPHHAVCLSTIEQHLVDHDRALVVADRSAIFELLRSIRQLTSANAALLLQITTAMHSVLYSVSRTCIPSITYDGAGQLRSDGSALELR